MEEAAYMKHDLFTKVVAPAMGVNHTAVLAISTPSDEDNYYSKMMEYKKPNGVDELFHTIRIGLACKNCELAGVPHRCTHKLAEQPPWKSQARLETLKSILSDDDYTREALGLVRGDSTYIFNNAWIKNFHERPVYDWQRPPNVLYTFIDPSGGGDASNYAILTMGFESGKDVVRYPTPYGLIVSVHVRNQILQPPRQRFDPWRMQPFASRCAVIQPQQTHAPDKLARPQRKHRVHVRNRGPIECATLDVGMPSLFGDGTPSVECAERVGARG